MKPLEISHSYDEQGWNVFPCALGEKSPTVAWKAFQNERTTPYLEGWFGHVEPGEVNFWIMCGPLSGLVVVDCDTAEMVELVLARIPEAGSTWQVETSKGRHFYFALGDGSRIKTYNLRGVGLEIDVRASGAGVVAPPSVHASGHRYRWLRGRSEGPLGELPEALRSKGSAEAVLGLSVAPGRSKGTPRTGLRELLGSPPAHGERNDWLTRVAGHYAKRAKGAEDFNEYQRKVRRANARLEEPLERNEVAKVVESIWTTEEAKRHEAETIRAGSGLKGDGSRMWAISADGDSVVWSNFDIDAVAVTVDPDTNKSWYWVAIKRESVGDVLDDILDGETLGSSTALQKWLGARRCAVVRNVGINPAARILLYLEEQNPPKKTMLPYLGWNDSCDGFATFEGVIRADGVVPHEGAVPIVNRDAAPYRYGFVEEGSARALLAEVLTFHDETVCAVFGAWWAACFLKAQVLKETALFPFVALEAPSESGKTSGFFSMMMALNGNFQGQAEYTLASLRDRVAAHRSGIVWIDDMAEVDEVLDLIRQATAEGSKSKMAEGWKTTRSVRLVAPVVLSGEYLGRLHNEKALLDRAVVLGVPSPVGRKSLVAGREGRSQWDDVTELRSRWGGDLTSAAGTLTQLALGYAGQVPKLKRLRVGEGRWADKMAVLRFGARVLAGITGERRWVDLVDAWVGEQVAPGNENDLTLHVLPELLAFEDWPGSASSKDPGRASSCFIEDGFVLYHEPGAAALWKKIAGREWNPRTQAKRALEQQRRGLGEMESVRRDNGAHTIRVRYWRLSRDISEAVIERSHARLRR